MAGGVVGQGVDELTANEIGGLQTREPVLGPGVVGWSPEALGQAGGHGGQVLAAGRLGGGGELLGPAPRQPLLRRPGQGRRRASGGGGISHPPSLPEIIPIITAERLLYP